MAVGLYRERRSFILFIALVLVTAFMLLSENSQFYFGILGIVWGIFGFLRLTYFLQDRLGSAAKIFSLSSQILFDAAERSYDRRLAIARRMSQIDIIFWLSGIFLFFLWILNCNYSPENISLVAELNAKQNELLEKSISYTPNIYTMISHLIIYGVINIIIFISLTYSLSMTHIKWLFTFIFPVFCLGALYVFIKSQWVTFLIFPDISNLKGGGLGQADILNILSKPLMENSGSGLFNRYVELGWVGAYGLYLLFLPAFILFIRTILQTSRSTLRPLMGLVILMLMLALDVLLISSTFTLSVQILGMVIVSMCWGAALPRQL